MGLNHALSSGIAFYINGEPDGEMRTFRGINDITLGYSAGSMEAVGGDIDAFNQYWHGHGEYMLGHYD